MGKGSSVKVRVVMLFACLALAVSMQLPQLLPIVVLPIILLACAGSGLAAIYIRHGSLLILTALCLGLAWGVFFSHWRMFSVLPTVLEGVDLQVEGLVSGLPRTESRHGQFVQRFYLEHCRIQNKNGEKLPLLVAPEKIQLTWYGGKPLLPGQRWQFKVRLKKPRGLANQAGFDYGLWQLQQGIDATGYVRRDVHNRLLADWDQRWNMDRWRMSLRESLSASMAGNAQLGIITALSIGDRTHISSEQWQLYQNSGTNHLLAISGLHVGLLAGLGYLLGCGLGRGLGWLHSGVLLRVPAQHFGALIAIFFALFYSALAGFSLPTMRASIMVVVFFVLGGFNRSASPFTAITVALTLILFMNPLVVFSPGFWLSFAAVAILLCAFGGRVAQGSRAERWLRPQWLVFLGLAPFLLLFFQQLPLVSPLANAIAIPVFSLLVIPFCLIGVALSLVTPVLGNVILDWVATLIGWVEHLVEQLLILGSHTLVLPNVRLDTVTLAAMMFGALLLISPAVLPGRRLGYVLLALPWMLMNRAIPDGEIQVDVLDVGQGLAVVLQTTNHMMVYDTGPSFGQHFDLGAAVVLPFIKSTGRQQIDQLVISHDNNDHAGGVNSVLHGINVNSLLSGEPLHDVPDALQQRCKERMFWQWDGVQFQVLHGGGSGKNSNDRSCVIQIVAKNARVLLTGDIGRAVEQSLVMEYGHLLQSDILLAPHHGSHHSSSQSFVDHVAAQYVVFPAGYRNRFDHPRAAVIERYRQSGAQMFNTAFAGAVHFESDKNNSLRASLFRQEHRHFWYLESPRRLEL